MWKTAVPPGVRPRTAQRPVCPSLTGCRVLDHPRLTSCGQMLQGGAWRGCTASESLAGAGDGPHRGAAAPLRLRPPEASWSLLSLQGLCKLGSAGGTDFSMKQFAEGSTLKLAKQCRK